MAVFACVMAAIVIWVSVRTKNNEQQEPKLIEQALAEHYQEKITNEPDKPAGNTVTNRITNIATEIPPAKTTSRFTIDDVIKTAWGWTPAYQSWYGKPAPDFTVTDLEGKTHRLSDYRGKDVMLVFWATWCMPCIQEVPHLIALRNRVDEDKLAILAISYISYNNTTEMVKQFVAVNERINYTVTSTDQESIPRPYNTINAIPTSFFIDRQGNVKLATSGALSLGSMKAILAAEN